MGTCYNNWSINTALSTIVKLNNIIGFLPISLDETLNAIVSETYKLYDSDTCCIHIIGAENNLDLVAFSTSDGLRPDVHITTSIENCTTIRDGLPYIAESSSICPNRKTQSDAPMSHVCIPLTTGKDIHGTFSISFSPERILSHDELNVLLSIANQTAMAIQRFRLFEKLKNEKLEIERACKEIKSLNERLENKMVELKETQKRLLQSERLAATGKLAAGLSHEINNPISIILNRIDCMKMEADENSLPQSIRDDLDVIYSYAAKVSSIVQDLLVFSRYYSVNPRVLSVKDVVERVREMLTEELKAARCRVVIDSYNSAGEVIGDPDRLEQVFYNLIKNAIDAMPGGGGINVRIEKSEERPGFVRISVSDEGEGIDDSIINRIFDPFFTTKKIGKGTGLGLSICYGIIKNHCGDIMVESKKGVGSTFHVYLPVSRSDYNNSSVEYVEYEE
jgi:signal transduction histidine kinase